MRGAVALTSTNEFFKVERGMENLATYRFGTETAEHHFCQTCGIYTHHKRRSNPDQLGINAACLEGVSPFDFAVVPVLDGQRHPSDDPQHRTYRLGELRFIPD